MDGLGLDAAGINHSAAGITVDGRMRTSNRRVYAIGDVTGPPMLTHAANLQAGVVIRNALFRLPAKLDISAMPWVTFSDPELAQVGMTEVAAREALTLAADDVDSHVAELAQRALEDLTELERRRAEQ